MLKWDMIYLLAMLAPSLCRPYDPEDTGLKSVLPSSGQFEAFYPREAHGIPNGSSRPAHGHGSFYKHRNPALVDVKNAAAYGFRFDGMRRFNFDDELLSMLLSWSSATCFWDTGTTTESGIPAPQRVRLSMFQWQVQTDWFEFWFPDWDWADSCYRRRMSVVAGLSIERKNLGVGALINRRTVVTSANIVEPYLDNAQDLRVWALGRGVYYYTPFRYRVWRARRVIPKSNNPEHEHGPRGTHIPRHDISIVHTREQIYLYPYLPRTYHYSIRALVPPKHMLLPDDMVFAGSGFETLLHIKQNYLINYQNLRKSDVVDCSRYLVKWWGKFICFKSNYGDQKRAGVPAGGPILTNDMYLMGIGCFEIRYNDDRISVFTDIRYYVDHIYVLANFTWGEYYEYAYQLYGNYLNWFWMGKNSPFIPAWPSFIMHDNFSPLGK